ncbi:hypothetical protein GT50_00400 [Geobacillus stearothermophilus 10]|nr:hypothetical protein GT50_00400 [Geobacillus stearothermophilus 10]
MTDEQLQIAKELTLAAMEKMAFSFEYGVEYTNEQLNELIAAPIGKMFKAMCQAVREGSA